MITYSYLRGIGYCSRASLADCAPNLAEYTPENLLGAFLFDQTHEGFDYWIDVTRGQLPFEPALEIWQEMERVWLAGPQTEDDYA